MTMPNFDNLRERIRERVTEPREGYGVGYCDNCQAVLTTADVEGGECSNCHSSIESDDEDFDDGWWED